MLQSRFSPRVCRPLLYAQSVITPVADTPAGSAEAIRGHIAKQADYAAAKKVLDAAKTAATKALPSWCRRCRGLSVSSATMTRN